MLKVEIAVVSMFATNCYLVYSEPTRATLVIDPGAEAKKIIDIIKRLNLDPKYIINTHGHIDHIGANGKIKAEFNVPIMLHKNDVDLYHNPGFGLKHVLKKQPQPDHFLKEDDIISIGSDNFKVIETPGHTQGGISILSGACLFSGDTLFAGSIGRTDLAGGSYRELMSSIHEKLLTLPADTKVYPGHGPLTTIGEETVSNPFLTE